MTFSSLQDTPPLFPLSPVQGDGNGHMNMLLKDTNLVSYTDPAAAYELWLRAVGAQCDACDNTATGWPSIRTQLRRMTAADGHWSHSLSRVIGRQVSFIAALTMGGFLLVLSLLCGIPFVCDLSLAFPIFGSRQMNIV